MATGNAENVTPIRTIGSEPPSPPKPSRKRRPSQPTPDLAFLDQVGNGPDTFTIFKGLKGVCRAMKEVEGIIDGDSVEQYGCLGDAAYVLVELLEDRML